MPHLALPHVVIVAYSDYLLGVAYRTAPSALSAAIAGEGRDGERGSSIGLRLTVQAFGPSFCPIH